MKYLCLPLGCEYGDKHKDCLSLAYPVGCYNNDNICCGTCGDMKDSSQPGKTLMYAACKVVAFTLTVRGTIWNILLQSQCLIADQKNMPDVPARPFGKSGVAPLFPIVWQTNEGQVNRVLVCHRAPAARVPHCHAHILSSPTGGNVTQNDIF